MGKWIPQVTFSGSILPTIVSCWISRQQSSELTGQKNWHMSLGNRTQNRLQAHCSLATETGLLCSGEREPLQPTSHPLRPCPRRAASGRVPERALLCASPGTVTPGKDASPFQKQQKHNDPSYQNWIFYVLLKGEKGKTDPVISIPKGFMESTSLSLLSDKLHLQREAGCKRYWTQVWLLPAQKPAIEGQVSVERKGALLRKVSNPERSWTLVQGPTLKIMLSQDNFKWKRGKQS